MEKLTRPLQVLVTQGEAERVLAVAKAEGRTISAWCRRVLVAAVAPVPDVGTPSASNDTRGVGACPPAPPHAGQPTSPTQGGTETACTAISVRCPLHRRLLPCSRCL